MNCPHCDHAVPLAAIPDAELNSEVGRRRVAKRTNNSGGRPVVPTRCRRCGEKCPTATAARAHCRVPRKSKSES